MVIHSVELELRGSFGVGCWSLKAGHRDWPPIGGALGCIQTASGEALFRHMKSSSVHGRNKFGTAEKMMQNEPLQAESQSE